MAFVIRMTQQLCRQAYPGQEVLEIRFDTATITAWSVGLVLLSHKMIDVLHLRDDQAGMSIRFSRLDNETGIARGVARSDAGGLEVFLTQAELSYWLNFFLLYCRDGYGSVDHLDVAFQAQPGGWDTIDLYLEVPHDAPPVPGKDADKLLNANRTRRRGRR